MRQSKGMQPTHPFGGVFSASVSGAGLHASAQVGQGAAGAPGSAPNWQLHPGGAGNAVPAGCVHLAWQHL
ncbi:MAG: hypothetical protein MUF62_02320 [Chitinophagaceae bacterium]|nr:hypothetical protein [Chitinophagaceae bacterium]